MIGYDRVNIPCDKPCLFCPEHAEQWFSNLLRRRTLPQLWKGGDLHGQTRDDQSSFQPFGQSEGQRRGPERQLEPRFFFVNYQTLSNQEFRRDDVVSLHYVIVNPLSHSTMSLVQGYSSDEEDTSAALHDAFNLAALPSTKRHRFEPTTSTTVAQAAPDVLAQVGHTYPDILHVI